jgi:hypothetical protein
MSYGGIGLLVIAAAGIFLAERLWVRVLCAAFVALVIICNVLVYGPKVENLLVPAFVIPFALYVREVVKGYGKY